MVPEHVTQTTLKKTPLNAAHRALGAKMVDFAGWDMPVHYGSQIEEHHAVRCDAGMFDVSHMLALDLTGPDAAPFLRRLLANDVGRLRVAGKALYSCMLNEDGGVIDDLIAYRMSDEWFRLVVNAGTAERDVAWIDAQRRTLAPRLEQAPRRDLAIIAVQGPRARAKLAAAVPGARSACEALAAFQGAAAGELFVARTGYTGEDGCEVMLPAGRAGAAWDALRAAGVQPAGLGARDTLRLEAGMNLYGQDMDESVSPLESGLAWTVDSATGRDFIGRAALTARPVERQLTGLVLMERGVMRGHQAVRAGSGRGEITSGGFAPTLNRSIALARVPRALAPGAEVEVEVRGKWLRARAVKPPFVRNGKVMIEI